MNEIGTALLWCAAQVTLVAVATGAIYVLLRRSGPALRSQVTLTALVVIALLSAAAHSPWPRWQFSQPAPSRDVANVPESHAASEITEIDESTALNATGFDEPLPADADESMENVVAAAPPNPPVQETIVSAPSNEKISSSGDVSRSSAAGGSIWVQLTGGSPAWFGSGRIAESGWMPLVTVLFLCALTCGLLRLLVGWMSVAGYRRRAVAIDDTGLLAVVDELKQKLACSKPVEVRESATILSAATVGARRPLVLLPQSWRNWNDSQLRAVMAHELAHIARNDFVSWVTAQAAVVLHFYHPLVHWLAGRLRLEQELAADAAAAPYAGGRERYLGILAEMALAGSSQTIGWPARAFLPGRGTLIKRIERLRDEATAIRSSSVIIRGCSLCFILLTGVAVAGLRSPADNKRDEPAELFAQADAAAAAAHSPDRPARPAEVLVKTYIPADARVVVSLKLSRILAAPEMKPLVEFLRNSPVFNGMGFPVESIEEMIAIPFRTSTTGRGSRSGSPLLAFGTTIIRTKDPADFKKLAEKVIPDTAKRSWRRQEYLAAKTDGNAADPICLYQPDERTVIFDYETGLKRIIETALRRPSRLVRGDAWQAVRGSHLAVVIDGRWLAELIDSPRGPAAAIRASALELGVFSPLWEEADLLAVGLNVGDKLELRGIVDCPDRAGAELVADTLKAFFTLARNAAGRYRDEVNRSAPKGIRERILAIVDLSDELLHDAKVTQADDNVSVTATADLDNLLVLLALEGMKSTVTNSRQTDSKRNLKQIGLAMHNYYDVNGRLPDTAMLGPDGQTPHSWRVALLPFIGHAELYAAYRLNEPWDSPHNLQVLKRMPPQYRHPAAAADSTNSSYFALAGPSTVFRGAEGMKFRDITDGTSNTILFVEAKREIPWTKPQDIPFNVAQDPPKLDGFDDQAFLVVLCDGSVRPFRADISPDRFKAWITPAGGEIIVPLSQDSTGPAVRIQPPRR